MFDTSIKDKHFWLQYVLIKFCVLSFFVCGSFFRITVAFPAEEWVYISVFHAKSTENTIDKA